MLDALGNVDLLVGFMSALIAAVGAATSVIFARRSARRESQLQEIELAHWKNQYLAEIRLWADQCVHALSVGVHLCDLEPSRTVEPSLFERRHRLLTDLSALIDRGRWFFPNNDLAANRKERRVFFRGYRDPLLDPLVAAYEYARQVNYVEQAKNMVLRDDFVAAKQDFTTKLQVVLDPSSRNADFERFLTLQEELQEDREKGAKKDVKP